MIILELKIESSINEVIEETANPGNIDTIAILGTLEMQPEELCEGELIDIHVESCCNEKDEGILE